MRACTSCSSRLTSGNGAPTCTSAFRHQVLGRMVRAVGIGLAALEHVLDHIEVGVRPVAQELELSFEYAEQHAEIVVIAIEFCQYVGHLCPGPAATCITLSTVSAGCRAGIEVAAVLQSGSRSYAKVFGESAAPPASSGSSGAHSYRKLWAAPRGRVLTCCAPVSAYVSWWCSSCCSAQRRRRPPFAGSRPRSRAGRQQLRRGRHRPGVAAPVPELQRARTRAARTAARARFAT